MCQGFNHFSDILHHFVIPKLATTSIRVKCIVSFTVIRLMLSGYALLSYILLDRQEHIPDEDFFHIGLHNIDLHA